MTKRTRDEETKATVMTVLLEGPAVSSVARECSIPKGTVPNWKQQEAAPPATLRRRSGSISFAYIVLLNVIRSFWAREGSPENSWPVRGAFRNSL